jgi:hypothetical protein
MNRRNHAICALLFVTGLWIRTPWTGAQEKALDTAAFSRAVVTAVFDRHNEDPSVVQTAVRSDPKVQLKTKDSAIELKAIYCSLNTEPGPAKNPLQWVQFNDLTAKLRARDPMPAILIESEKDPRAGWFWIKAIQYNRKGNVYRYFDVLGGGAFSAGWSGKPEGISTVPYEATQEKPGLWRLTPVKALKPGEYALFSGQREGQAIVFDFGVDK